VSVRMMTVCNSGNRAFPASDQDLATSHELLQKTRSAVQAAVFLCQRVLWASFDVLLDMHHLPAGLRGQRASIRTRSCPDSEEALPLVSRGEKRKGKLDLRTLGSILKGGTGGAVVIGGKPHKSVLLTRVAKGEMPPGDAKKLSTAEIAIIGNWILAGIPADKPVSGSPQATSPISDEDRRFWSFQPLARPEVPAGYAPRLTISFWPSWRNGVCHSRSMRNRWR